MKRKKFKSYLDIMDEDEELKIYKKICKGKNKEIKYYTQWRDHILEKILNASPERICNFKRYCYYRMRHVKISVTLYLQICISFLSVYVTIAILDIIDVERKLIFTMACFLTATIILVRYVFCDYQKREFYEDIIEIIDDYQMNKGVDPICQTVSPNTIMKTP